MKKVIEKKVKRGKLNLSIRGGIAIELEGTEYDIRKFRQWLKDHEDIASDELGLISVSVGEVK